MNKKRKKQMLSMMLVISILFVCIVWISQKNIQASPADATDDSKIEQQSIESTETIASTSTQEKNKQQASEELASEQKLEPVVQAETKGLESDLVNELKEGWTELPKGSRQGVIVNPINKARMGFFDRGIELKYDSYSKLESGFRIRDGDNLDMFYKGEPQRIIPLINNTTIYDGRYIPDKSVNDHEKDFKKIYYLKKDESLREIIVDDQNQVVYVYDLSLAPTLNFKMTVSMYNSSLTARDFSIVEYGDMNYLGAKSAVKMLGNNSQGFYGQGAGGKFMAIKLKDSAGQWLSEYTRMAPGAFGNVGGDEEIPHDLVYYNWFGNDFSKAGVEQFNFPANYIVTERTMSAYQLGAPPRNIAPGDALSVGEEVFLGNELPYMQFATTPKELNVYEDYKNDFTGDYTLTGIPNIGDEGNIKFTYPNGQVEEKKYVADADKQSSGTFEILRDQLPEVLNEQTGKVETYYTDILATNTTGISTGLVSKEFAFPINVYKFGAKPAAQVLKKGEAFTKEAKELIREPVILPEHTASYDYEGTVPDTLTEGLKYAYVRMTDTDQPDKTTVIKVPVQVIDNTLPTEGLFVAAKDILSSAASFKDLDENELKQKILDLSEAVAWGIETGSTEGIALTVESTNVPPSPSEGTYTATIKAVKGNMSKTKEITIKLLNEQNITVAFLGEAGIVLHEPVVLRGAVGSVIDLKKEVAVQKVLQEIEKAHYVLVKAPDNESAITVKEEEMTVQYQFKGCLFIDSSPTQLNFGDQYLTRPWIKVEHPKYDIPLIIGDNRKDKKQWTLLATVENPLTSEDSLNEILPRALLYKLNESTEIVLKKGEAQPVEVGTVSTTGVYNVSENWEKNNTGVELNIFSSEINQKGHYKASILWQLGETP